MGDNMFRAKELCVLPHIDENAPIDLNNKRSRLSVTSMKQKHTNGISSKSYGSHEGRTVSDDSLIKGNSLENESQRIRAIMISLYLGIFLASLDNTVIATLLPHIASEFNALPKVSLVAAAYLFSCAIFQPLFGKISDIFGRKSLILWSNIVFFLGCLICGASSNVLWLILGRFITGIGGGGITSLSSIIISDIIPLRNRAVYQGGANFFYALGTAAGGVLGGFFSQHRGGWRTAFLIQLPFCFISANLIFFFLHLERDEITHPAGSTFKSKLKKVDWLGLTTLLGFLSLFMTASTVGFSCTSFTLTLILALMLLFGGSFTYLELKVASDPILPISLLSNRTIIASSMANWFWMMAMMTINYYVPIYWSSVLRMEPVEIGKRCIPSFFSIAVGSFGTGFYLKRRGKYFWFLMSSCVISIIGLLQINLMTPDLPTWKQYCLLVLPGIGTAVLITVALIAMTSAVAQEYQAAVTSISYAFRTTGCTLGVSIGAAIFQRSLVTNLRYRVMQYLSNDHSREELLKIIDKASRSSEWANHYSPTFIQDTLISCYDSASHSAFKFCFICIVLATLFCCLIKENPLHSAIKKHHIVIE